MQPMGVQQKNHIKQKAGRHGCITSDRFLPEVVLFFIFETKINSDVRTGILPQAPSRE